MKSTMVHARGGTLAAHEDTSDPVLAFFDGPVVAQSWRNKAGDLIALDARGRLHVTKAHAANGDNKAPAGPVDEAGAKAAELGKLRGELSLLRVRLDQYVADGYPATLVNPLRDEVARLEAAIARLEGSAPTSASLEAAVREMVAKEPNIVASIDEATGLVRTIVMPKARPLPGAAETMTDKLKRSRY